MESNTNKLAQSTNTDKDDDSITGIKLLLKLKQCQKVYDDYINNGSIDQFGNIIQNDELLYRLMNETIEDEASIYNQKETGIELDYMNEKSTKMISDVDRMLKEITETRRQIQLNKDIQSIKTKEDYLGYWNIKPKSVTSTIENNKDTEVQHIDRIDNYKNYTITKDNDNEKKYDQIKERLKTQEMEIKHKQIENTQDKTNKPNQLNKIHNDNVVFNYNNDDTDKLFEEIRLANSRMDNFISELDECIELNEKIDKELAEE